MNHVLLIGAGFSRNWNGWLANEIIDDLLGRLTDHQDLSDLLRKTDNFEEALSQIQIEFKSHPNSETVSRLNHFQTAILDSFGAMNQAFASIHSIEFSDKIEFSIQKFLARFDAIFTLNQDLLFELHYNIETHGAGRWNGHNFPSMQPPMDWRTGLLKDRLDYIWRTTSDFQVSRNLQPIFKLHGSVNWRDQDNGQLLVIGGNKESTVQEKEMLKWYSDQFKGYLQIPNTRLMVIGYGFLDHYLNKIIYDAWEQNKFSMFIVHPRGRKAIPAKDQLEKISSIGASTRLLSSTFAGDHAEHGKLMRFFS
jgi:SIR2-like protein